MKPSLWALMGRNHKQTLLIKVLIPIHLPGDLSVAMFTHGDTCVSTSHRLSHAAENLSLPSSCSQSTGDASSSSDHGDNDFASIINAAENLSLPSSCSQSISDGSASTDHGDNHSDDGKEG